MRWLLLLCLFASPLAAQQRQPIDYVLVGTNAGLLLADWSQTLQIARDPLRHGEQNALLGLHPSVGRVNTYFAVSFIANAAILWLPTTPRRIGYVGLIAWKAHTVIRNHRLGLTIGF
jgi:hypothetical protein